MPSSTLRCLAAGAALAAMACIAGPALAQTTIYDATGGTENGGDSFKSAGRLLFDEILNGPSDETVTSVVLNLLAIKPQDGGEFRIVLRPLDSNGLPTRPQVIVGTVTDASLTQNFALTTVTPTRKITLKANTRYFIGVVGHPGFHSSVTLGNTVDPTVLSRPSVIAGGYYYNNGGLQANSGGPYEIQVNVTP